MKKLLALREKPADWLKVFQPLFNSCLISALWQELLGSDLMSQLLKLI